MAPLHRRGPGPKGAPSPLRRDTAAVVLRVLTARAVQRVLMQLQELDAIIAGWLHNFVADNPPSAEGSQVGTALAARWNSRWGSHLCRRQPANCWQAQCRQPLRYYCPLASRKSQLPIPSRSFWVF